MRTHVGMSTLKVAHIYICIMQYKLVHVCICTYIYMCTNIYMLYTYVYIYIYIKPIRTACILYITMPVCVLCVYDYICIYTCVYLCIYMYIYAYPSLHGTCTQVDSCKPMHQP